MDDNRRTVAAITIVTTSLTSSPAPVRTGITGFLSDWLGPNRPTIPTVHIESSTGRWRPSCDFPNDRHSWKIPMQGGEVVTTTREWTDGSKVVTEKVKLKASGTQAPAETAIEITPWGVLDDRGRSIVKWDTRSAGSKDESSEVDGPSTFETLVPASLIDSEAASAPAQKSSYPTSATKSPSPAL